MYTPQLAADLAAVALAHGCTLRPVTPWGYDELALEAAHPTNPDGAWHGRACGPFGERFAAILNESNGARTGAREYGPTRYLLPENGWCFLTTYAARQIVAKYHPATQPANA